MVLCIVYEETSAEYNCVEDIWRGEKIYFFYVFFFFLYSFSLLHLRLFHFVDRFCHIYCDNMGYIEIYSTILWVFCWRLKQCSGCVEYMYMWTKVFYSITLFQFSNVYMHICLRVFYCLCSQVHEAMINMY